MALTPRKVKEKVQNEGQGGRGRGEHLRGWKQGNQVKVILNFAASSGQPDFSRSSEAKVKVPLRPGTPGLAHYRPLLLLAE